MHKSTELTPETHDSLFTKGMTLEQYLSRNLFDKNELEEEGSEKEQQNLYESSRSRRMESFKPRKSNYRIDQIDEESMEDSISSTFNEGNSISKNNLKTKESQFQANPLLNNRSNPRINNVHINSNMFLQNSMNEKHIQKPNFRVKKASVSPHKRSKNEGGMGIGSITLYGNKFNLSTNKKQNKMPELITFYGKLNHNNADTRNTRKTNPKSIENKYNFNKKNYLELNELIEFQNRIKLNYSERAHYDERKEKGKEKGPTRNQNIY